LLKTELVYRIYLGGVSRLHRWKQTCLRR